MNEADTCRTYVLPKLKSAGWDNEMITKQMVLTPGRIVPIGTGTPANKACAPITPYSFNIATTPLPKVNGQNL